VNYDDGDLLRKIEGILDGAKIEIVAMLQEAGVSISAQVPISSGLVIGAGDLTDDFTFRWPDKIVRSYGSACRYAVDREKGSSLVFVIGTEPGGRAAYGRQDRGRIVVFLEERSGVRPIVEFAESDLDGGEYVAGVPRISRPRAIATADDLDGLRAVPHLATADLRRTDEVYTATVDGPSLRLVTPVDNSRLMIEHAYWIGVLRNYIKPV
jgi:hypothetical protein